METALLLVRSIRLHVVALVAGLTLQGGAPAHAYQQPEPSPEGTILFSSLAPRGWDLYLTDLADKAASERRLTTHPAIDYNAAFSADGGRIAFVSERDGNPELYLANRDGTGLVRLTKNFAFDDHPTWSPDGDKIAFCSTRQPAAIVGKAWNAIYIMDANGCDVTRISPEGQADYSPAWSPKGDWIACASGSGVAGKTDLYVMKPDGSGRKLVIKDGGWPSFAADGRSLFFHRRHADKWGIWRVDLDGSNLRRVTPADIEAFTPRASTDGRWLVMAVRRDRHRQIERMTLATGELVPLTREPTNHWNPAISPDGQVVYQKSTPGYVVPNVELWGTPPGHGFQMLRVSGAFPATSPDGSQFAVTVGSFKQIDVMNIDGSQRKRIFKGDGRDVFGLTWFRLRNEQDEPADEENGQQRIAFAYGKAFREADGKVAVETIAPDGSARETFLEEDGNNAFVSFSPGGRQVVFRSGRDGTKSLYIMDHDGNKLRQLTRGQWTDTMPDWSPTGQWIAFASNRDSKGFAIWVIRPDGTGLRKVLGGDVLHNHPRFSPDGKWIVFTSQLADVSAEVVSLPHQFQPYGELFAIRLDGTGLTRLTHNGFEEGTPAWGPATDVQPSAAGSAEDSDEF